MAYASISNGLADEMVRTIKNNLSELITVEGEDWEARLGIVLVGYRRFPLPDRVSPFTLLYGSKKKKISSEVSMVATPATTEDQRVDIMVLHSLRAGIINPEPCRSSHLPRR